MVWYGMVWYGMVWYGMVWYGMVWYGSRQGSAGFPFPGKNGKEKVNFPPFSLPNGKSTLFPSHFLPLLIILNISFPFPPHTNSTQNFLPICFPYQQKLVTTKKS